MSSYYQKHIFICCNKKESGKKCCSDGGGEQAFEKAKSLLQENKSWGPGKIRVSKSGCLGRCASGPVMAIYPEGCWYTYSGEDDVREIVSHHINSSIELENDEKVLK